MKIESIYISGFGKFKDYRLIFSDGFNAFYGENEDGKTTILTFIKMMFYGSSVKGNDISKNPRKKYLPWDNTAMAGSIDFTFKGKLYRIERNFGASNTSDKVTLINLDEGTRESYSGTTELGAKFFSISAAAFERCVFIGQLNLGEIGNDNSGELNTKLSSLALSGEEDVSEKTVASRLISAKEELMSKSGRKGKYDLNRFKLTELDSELEESRETEEKREALALKIDNQKNRLSLVLKEIDRIKASLKATESHRKFKKLKDYIEALDQLESLERKLKKSDGSIISITDLTEVEDALNKYKLLKQSLPNAERQLFILNSEINSAKNEANEKSPLSLTKEKIEEQNKKIKETKEKIDSLINQNAEIERKENALKSEKPKINVLFPIVSALLLISSALLFYFDVLKNSFNIAIAASGIVFLLLTFIVKKKPKGLSRQEKLLLENGKENLGSLNGILVSLRNEHKQQTELYDVLLKEADDAALLKEEKLKLKTEKEAEFNEMKKVIAELESFFLNFFQKENITASVSGMEIVLHAYKDYSKKAETARTRISLLKTDLGNLSKKEAEIQLSLISKSESRENDPKILEENLNFKQKEAMQIQKSISFDEATLHSAFLSHRHPTEIEHEIEALKKTLESQKNFCDSVDIALKALSQAFASTRKSFGGILEKRTAEILSGITGGKYKAVNISKDFDIAVESGEVFGSREWQYLSSGTADQAYFALRLAISEILSKECGGLPIFLDDSFAQYDDSRLSLALNFLNDYAKENQVVYFTCHKSNLSKNQKFNSLI